MKKKIIILICTILILIILCFLLYNKTTDICNIGDNEDVFIERLTDSQYNYSVIHFENYDSYIVDSAWLYGVLGNYNIKICNNSINQISFTANNSYINYKKMYLYICINFGAPYNKQNTEIFDGYFFNKNNKEIALYVNRKDNSISVIYK